MHNDERSLDQQVEDAATFFMDNVRKHRPVGAWTKLQGMNAPSRWQNMELDIEAINEAFKR